MNQIESPYRNILLNQSIVSAETKGFITVKRSDSTELLEIRPTIHLTEITPFGECKTTTANRIRNYCTGSLKNHPFHKVSSVTAPAIAGSIDEKFRVTPPLNADYINGTIIIDEFNTNPVEKSNAIGSALDVLESEESSRATARKPKKPISNENTKYHCKIENGRIWFYNLRSNWIFLTAKYLQMNRSLPMAMLLSRTIPIVWNPDYKELNAIDDNPDLLFKPLNLPVPELKTIENSEYLKIRNHVQTKFEPLNIPTSYYFRTVNDCVRAYVFSGYQHDFNLYDYILKNKIMFVSDYEKQGKSLAELEAEAENLMRLTGGQIRSF